MEKASTPRLGSSYYKLFCASVVSNLGDGMATVAYPWLATAVTRNPLLVALVAVAQRLPWLVLSIPVGVITDRVDRRRAMVAMDGLRFVVTLAIAFAVLGQQTSLPGPDEVSTVVGTRTGLYLAILAATLLLGSAEVLRDNSAQTILPSIVEDAQLEKANGRMWSLEGITNTLIGPPLGSLLLLIAFSVPFFVDAGTFLVAAALVALIPGSFRAERGEAEPNAGFRAEMAEGVRWLRGHSLLWPMGIVLGVMNGAMYMTTAVFVLFAQEVLDIGPFLFTVLGFGGAIGGLAGGSLASTVSKRLGSGTSLAVALGGMAVIPALIGSLAWWPAVLVLFTIEALLGILWNVITVSLRQAIIPERLLGRVNGVYRFLAWGVMPIGAAAGGLIVLVVDAFASREVALRSVFFVVSAILGILFVWGRPLLTTEKLEAARAAGRVG